MVRLSLFGSLSECKTHQTQVAGESGLGKTTFINTLFSTTIKNYADHRRRHAKQVDKTVEIEITKAELEEKFFKGAYTLIRGNISRELTLFRA